MKPFPEILQKLYPYGVGGRVPDRPWWTKGKGWDITKHRWDGAEGFNFEQIEQLDTITPIPHPGFRPGQIWSVVTTNVFGEDVITIITVTHGINYNVFDGFLIFDPCGMAPWSPSV